MISNYLQLRVYNDKNEEMDQYDLESHETIDSILYPVDGYVKAELYSICFISSKNCIEYKIANFSYNKKNKKWEIVNN